MRSDRAGIAIAAAIGLAVAPLPASGATTMIEVAGCGQATTISLPIRRTPKPAHDNSCTAACHAGTDQRRRMGARL